MCIRDRFKSAVSISYKVDSRVDLIRDRDGGLKLIELELIEPYLYLPHSKGEDAENEGAQKLAKALLDRLG